MRCSVCGAALRADATWCSQCHAPVVEQVEEPPAPRRQGVLEDPVRRVPTFSRWRKGDLSMGPVGRLAWTLGMTLEALDLAYTGNIFALVPWCLIAMPLVLRSVWAKKRIT